MKRLIVGLAVLTLLVATSAYGDVFNMDPGLTSLEMVRVGNPRNDPDDEVMWPDNTTGYGRVDYEYRISKYEVTNAQYIEFLNAVAAWSWFDGGDPYGLYNTNMAGMFGGIDRTGSGMWDDPWVYSPKGADANWLNRPVNFVSWGDAARFANWLHNDQPTGGQYKHSSTESGAYYLNGATSIADLMAVTRLRDATWFIPTENEWYKAAYYDGGDSVYHDYPTGTDATPSNVLTDPDPGNNANFSPDDHTVTVGTPYLTTEVGEFENSESPYGTFDQGGNLTEWNETGITGSWRDLRGGHWQDDSSHMHASRRDMDHEGFPTHEAFWIGFRVASVPEPGSITLLVCGAIALLACARRKRRR